MQQYSTVHGCHGNFIFYQWLHFDYQGNLVWWSLNSMWVTLYVNTPEMLPLVLCSLLEKGDTCRDERISTQFERFRNGRCTLDNYLAAVRDTYSGIFVYQKIKWSWSGGKLIWWEWPHGKLTTQYGKLTSWELTSWEVDLVGVDLVGSWFHEKTRFNSAI